MAILESQELFYGLELGTSKRASAVRSCLVKILFVIPTRRLYNLPMVLVSRRDWTNNPMVIGEDDTYVILSLV